jgi:hypothetical protein
MAEILGDVQFVQESATGDQNILAQAINVNAIDSTTPNNRTRLDVPTSLPAQRLAPSPSTGRTVQGLVNYAIQANGFLLAKFKNAAASTALVTASASTIISLSIVVNDLTLANGDPGKFRVRTLRVADRNTNRVADNPTLVNTQFRDLVAFQCPTGQAWLMHGDHQMFLSDA